MELEQKHLTKITRKDALYLSDNVHRNLVLHIAQSLQRHLAFYEVDWDPTPISLTHKNLLYKVFVANLAEDISLRERYINKPNGVITLLLGCFSPICRLASSGCYSPTCPKRTFPSEVSNSPMQIILLLVANCYLPNSPVQSPRTMCLKVWCDNCTQ